MKKIVLIGHPVAHSFSPRMQNAGLAAVGLENQFRYEALDLPPEAIRGFVSRVRAGEFIGGNVTIPYKIEVMRHLDGVSEGAHLLGAVNTVVLKEGAVIGFNTDGPGFLNALAENGVAPACSRAVVIGAGGAARAVAFSLARNGAREIVFVNRNLEHASLLALELKTKTPADTLVVPPEGVRRVISNAQLLVNCTPLGQKGPHENEIPLAESSFPPGLVVIDSVYNPRETRLLREARAAGCKTVSGEGMLLHQGALSFKMWTGVDAPLEAMRAALSEALA